VLTEARRFPGETARLLPVLLLIAAYATVVQAPGANENAHYALTRALAHGTAVVDPYRSTTKDVSWYHGHYYVAKAPGLALLTAPVYVVLKRVHAARLVEGRVSARFATALPIWALGLVGVVLPAAVLLLLIYRVADAFEPQLGPAVAVTAGLGTLILPFSTLFFDHMLGAALGFASFFVIWSRQGGKASLVSGGVLAGLAVTADYPLALVAIGIGLYAISRGARIGGILAYGIGFTAGALPLFAYNRWAFGSVTHFPYEDAVLYGGRTGHDVLGANSHGLFGVGLPSFPRAVALLFAPTGLLTLAPVLAMGAAGLVLLYHRRRKEALLFAFIGVAYLVYNSGYRLLFGGYTPGPRFLIPALPFLAVGLAPSFRRFPASTTVLAVSSALTMTAVTVSSPELAWDYHWLSRIADRSFAGFGVVPMIPFFLLVGASVFLICRMYLPAWPARDDIRAAVTLFLGWTLVAFGARRLLDGGFLAALVVLACAAGVALLSAALYKTGCDRRLEECKRSPAATAREPEGANHGTDLLNTQFPPPAPPRFAREDVPPPRKP
jgi:hypothetical protein